MTTRGIAVVACLAMLLIALPAVLSSPTGESSATSCTPGDVWAVDCNTCRCTETGIAACTRKGCLKLPGN